MKLIRITGVLFFIFFVGCIMEAEAVRPPLKPLNSAQFQKMIADADVIAIGVVSRVNLSKTLQPPLETVTIQATLRPERVLKGSSLAKNITIEESYQQFFKGHTGAASGNWHSAEKDVTAHIAGPLPPVGSYHEGERILVFLKSTGDLNQYQPLGSGKYDAYLAVFQITPEGVKPDKYRLDEILGGHAKTGSDFIKYIISIKGEH